jgi:hypothetical protein
VPASVTGERNCNNSSEHRGNCSTEGSERLGKPQRCDTRCVTRDRKTKREHDFIGLNHAKWEAAGRKQSLSKRGIPEAIERRRQWTPQQRCKSRCRSEAIHGTQYGAKADLASMAVSHRPHPVFGLVVRVLSTELTGPLASPVLISLSPAQRQPT